MYGLDILCGISKGTFEIPHKISYPYIGRFHFHTKLKFQELLDLRAHKCFWNAPLVMHIYLIELSGYCFKQWHVDFWFQSQYKRNSCKHVYENVLCKASTTLYDLTVAFI